MAQRVWPTPVVDSEPLTHVVEALVLEEAEPRRVVAPVLETFEALEQKILRSPRAYVTDDPAHSKTPS